MTATIFSHPAGLDVEAALHDDVPRTVAVELDNGTPVDVTGWEWETEMVEVAPVLGEPSKIRLTWDTGRSGSRAWFLTRTNLGRRRVLSGRVVVSRDADPPPVNAEWTLVLSENDEDIVLQVSDVPAVETLNDLTDVDAPAPDDGDVLTWDNATTSWVALPVAAAVVPLSDDDPEALGTVAPGVSTDVSRADHVHPFPDVLDGGTP